MLTHGQAARESLPGGVRRQIMGSRDSERGLIAAHQAHGRLAAEGLPTHRQIAGQALVGVDLVEEGKRTHGFRPAPGVRQRQGEGLEAEDGAAPA